MWHEVGVSDAVTSIARASYPLQSRFAVGYADGSIRLWDSETNTALLTLNGHQRAVTTMAFDAQGLHLVSGSQDTTIVVWDVVAETGMFRCVSRRPTLLTAVSEGTTTRSQAWHSSGHLHLMSSKQDRHFRTSHRRRRTGLSSYGIYPSSTASPLLYPAISSYGVSRSRRRRHATHRFWQMTPRAAQRMLSRQRWARSS